MARRYPTLHFGRELLRQQPQLMPPGPVTHFVFSVFIGHSWHTLPFQIAWINNKCYRAPMDHKEKAEAIHQFFLSFADRKEERLENAEKSRQEMTAALDAEQEPTGPRVEWIKENAQTFFDLMAMSADRYEIANPDDMITVNDVADVIATIQGSFEHQQAEKEQEEDATPVV